MEKSKNISEKKILESYIYIVKCQKKQGIGIFCKIYSQNLFLITTKNLLIQNHPIEINLNNKTINLNTDNSYNDNDIAIIEINQYLSDISFINIDNSIIDDPNKKYKDKEVYLYDFILDNGKIKENIGIILDINSGIAKIDFLCFRAENTLGGLIIYNDKDNDNKMDKLQLLGIYIKSNNKKYWKDGTFIKQYIINIKNNFNHKKNIKYINPKSNNYNINSNNVNEYKDQLNKITNQVFEKANNNNRHFKNINYDKNNKCNNNSNNNIFNENNKNSQYNNNNYNENNMNSQYNNNNYNENNMNNQYNSSNYNFNGNNINSKYNNNNCNENNMNNQYNNNNYNKNNMNILYNNNYNENSMNNQYNNSNNNNCNENDMNNHYNNNDNLNYQYNNNIMNNQCNQNINNNNEIFYQNNNNMINNPENFNFYDNNNLNNNNMNAQNNNDINNGLNQNNNMNNPNNQNSNDNYEDIYPYIKDNNKYKITFITQKFGNKQILIPSSLRNCELYYTADKINNPYFFEYSDVKFIELIYNNNVIIINDDNLIGNYMSDGSQIFIKEKNEYNACYQNEEMMNIIFKSDKVKKINLAIPYNITVKNLIYSFFNKFTIAQQNQKYFSFFFNDKELKLTDNKIYNEGFSNGNVINFETKIVKNDSNYEYLKSNCPGKKITAFLNDKNKKINLNSIIFAGTLQQIKNFYKELKKYLSQQKIEFEGAPIIIYQNNSLELDENNENTFSSYGIRNDFICQIELKTDS